METKYLIHSKRCDTFILHPDHNGIPLPRLFHSMRGANRFIEARADASDLQVWELFLSPEGLPCGKPVGGNSKFFKQLFFNVQDLIASIKDE